MKRNEVLRYKVNKITIKYVVTSNMHSVTGTQVLHSVMHNIICLLFAEHIIFIIYNNDNCNDIVTRQIPQYYKPTKSDFFTKCVSMQLRAYL